MFCNDQSTMYVYDIWFQHKLTVEICAQCPHLLHLHRHASSRCIPKWYRNASLQCSMLKSSSCALRWHNQFKVLICVLPAAHTVYSLLFYNILYSNVSVILDRPIFFTTVSSHSKCPTEVSWIWGFCSACHAIRCLQQKPHRWKLH